MNKAKAQDAINNIISDLHNRIGGKAARKQYAPSKTRINELTELGLIDLMPEGFGNSDAKAVIEAANASTGGYNAYGEGESWSNALQDAMNELEVIEAAPRVGDRVRIINPIRYQHLKTNAIVVPAIEHHRGEFETIIVEILQDKMEDEHFNPVVVFTYVMANGEIFGKDDFVIIS